MSRLLVVGADPGGTTGLCGLLYQDKVLIRAPVVLQTSAGSVARLTSGLLQPSLVWPPDSRRLSENTCSVHATVLAIERFVVGPRAGRSRDTGAGKATRELVEELRLIGERAKIRVLLRSASDVKPWATNARLKAAGLLPHLRGLPHAADACRHALFAAVHDCGIPDPLSRGA